MNTIKVIVVAVAVYLLGIALYPRLPKSIEPGDLLNKSLASERTSKQMYLREHKLFYSSRYIEFESSDLHEMISTPTITADDLQIMFTPLLEGSDVVSGRPCWTIRLKPKEKRFPWKQLWIDKQTSEILALRDWSWDNNLKRSMRVKKSLGHSSKRQSVASDPSPINAMQKKFIEHVPIGYRVVDEYCTSGCCVSVLSDGLYTVTIYSGKNIPFDCGVLSQNTAYAWGQGMLLYHKIDDINTLIIGDLSPEELAKIAASTKSR